MEKLKGVLRFGKRLALARGGIYAYFLAAAVLAFINPLIAIPAAAAGYLIGNHFGDLADKE